MFSLSGRSGISKLPRSSVPHIRKDSLGNKIEWYPIEIEKLIQGNHSPNIEHIGPAILPPNHRSSITSISANSDSFTDLSSGNENAHGKSTKKFRNKKQDNGKNNQHNLQQPISRKTKINNNQNDISNITGNNNNQSKRNDNQTRSDCSSLRLSSNSNLVPYHRPEKSRKKLEKSKEAKRHSILPGITTTHTPPPALPLILQGEGKVVGASNKICWIQANPPIDNVNKKFVPKLQNINSRHDSKRNGIKTRNKNEYIFNSQCHNTDNSRSNSKSNSESNSIHKSNSKRHSKQFRNSNDSAKKQISMQELPLKMISQVIPLHSNKNNKGANPNVRNTQVKSKLNHNGKLMEHRTPENNRSIEKSEKAKDIQQERDKEPEDIPPQNLTQQSKVIRSIISHENDSNSKGPLCIIKTFARKGLQEYIHNTTRDNIMGQTMHDMMNYMVDFVLPDSSSVK